MKKKKENKQFSCQEVNFKVSKVVQSSAHSTQITHIINIKIMLIFVIIKFLFKKMKTYTKDN